MAAPPDDLYRRFLDPPREHTIQPYWSWVEDIDPNEVRRQIREMVSQHVHGALVFAFDGLRTPYLSEQWMKGMEAALDEARKQRFTLGFITDYSFPQGDFRDIWNLDPPQSHVVRANPAFRRKRLAYVESLVDGPFPVSLRGLKNPAVAVAGKMDANGAYLEETLSELTPRIRGGQIGNAGEGPIGVSGPGR